jgi:hypothetical protein
MTEIRKVVTKKDLIRLLEEGQVPFPPLVFAPPRPLVAQEGGTDGDVLLEARWGARAYRFVVACRSLDTPKAIAAAADEARRASRLLQANPMIFVPYLSPEQLSALEGQGISGLDLGGNGVLVVPDELLVYRTGFPNRGPRSAPIKNVYRGTSSVVARVFLLKSEHSSVNEVWAEIRQRGGRLTLGTVSKVCRSSLRLLQPDKLLDRLMENYAAPDIGARFVGKAVQSPEELRTALTAWQRETSGRAVLTGACSVDAYAVMAREPVQAFYCSDVKGALNWLGDGVRETPRFANLTLLETTAEFPYFDARPNLTASPAQAYLELTTGDKRDCETADQVRRAVLAGLQANGGDKGAQESAHDQPA